MSDMLLICYTSIENKSSVIYTLYFYSFNYSRCLCCPEIQNHHTEEVNIFFIPHRSTNISVYERLPYK